MLCDGNLTSNSCLPTPLVWHLPVPRVVGTGLSADLNTDGTLKNPDLLVANGVISRNAQLSVWVKGSFKKNCTVEVKLNGSRVSTPTLMANSAPDYPDFVFEKCIPIDIKYVRFPQRAQVGGSPTPAVNTLEVISLDPAAMDGSEKPTIGPDWRYIVQRDGADHLGTRVELRSVGMGA
jgi:hypothetical protein